MKPAVGVELVFLQCKNVAQYLLHWWLVGTTAAAKTSSYAPPSVMTTGQAGVATSSC